MGCVPANSNRPATKVEARIEASGSRTEPKPIFLNHDFGVILGGKSVLTHKFRLLNRISEPLRLLNPTSYLPCCSSIGSLPDEIPPHGEVEVSVVFKIHSQQGRGRVNFSIDTDSKIQTGWYLSLGAELLPEWVIEDSGGDSLTFPIGQVGSREFRVVTRRRSSEGLPPPSTVSATPPLSARFTSVAVDSLIKGDVIESTRNVHVFIPAATEPGTQYGNVTFGWDSSETKRSRRMNWRITPALEAFPSGFALGPLAGASTQVVVIRSTKYPFRILAVDNPLEGSAPEYDRDAKTAHLLKIHCVYPRLSVPNRLVKIRIRTDHPIQKELTMTVMVLPEKGGNEE